MKKSLCFSFFAVSVLFLSTARAGLFTLQWDHPPSAQESFGWKIHYGTIREAITGEVDKGQIPCCTASINLLDNTRYWFQVSAYDISNPSRVSGRSNIVFGMKSTTESTTNALFVAQALPAYDMFASRTPFTLPGSITGKPLAGKVHSTQYDSAILHNNGTWYVDVNGTWQTWISNFGTNSANQFLGDVNGDGLADVVVYFSGPAPYSGNWYVALNRGGRFEWNGGSPWASGFGNGSQKQLLGDFNGDNSKDVAVLFTQ
jgi:hypothetical protein